MVSRGRESILVLVLSPRLAFLITLHLANHTSPPPKHSHPHERTRVERHEAISYLSAWLMRQPTGFGIKG